MTDRVGQQFGNYQLIQLLGQGSSAEVYLGKHRYLNSYAALKVLHATLHPRDEHTFLAEAQTLVDLRHPNIIHLLDFGIENGTPVLIMDYAPKGSLRQHYPQGTHLPLTTVVDFVAQIAAALQHAHNHHVIHRDVKPGNILLDADNRLLLSDFGISLLTPSSQRPSTQNLAGTPRYIAPEQLRSQPCFASDQYALAVMVYEWLCGELLFRGNMWEISQQHMHTAPPPLRTIRPELPLMLEKFVLRALAKKPQDRFVSIQAFARALARTSQISIPVDEHASQVTAPLQAIPRASPTSHFPFIFLSYARKDFNSAKSIKDDMIAQGVAGWIDNQASSSGISEEERLREAIRNASAVILVATPHTRRSLSVKGELQIAEMYQRPIYVLWVKGSQFIEVIPTGWNRLDSFDARGECYQKALQELLQAFRKRKPPSLAGNLPVKEGITPPITPRNPYKGLQTFHREDAQDFFGRDRLIDELVEKVRQMLVTHPSGEVVSRLLTVVGASGSGKSSVVMAGLLPDLQQGVLPGSQHWKYLAPIVPGQHPIKALTLTLSSLFPERSLESIQEDLEDDSARGLHLLLAESVREAGTMVVLLVDQFEELFTQTSTEEERRRFLDLLLAAVTEPAGSLLVVFTLRADFYDRPLQYPELGRLIETQHVTAYPLETQDLRAVIKRPAQLPDVQLAFEEDLIGDLLFEVQGQMGALPLLQFTLDQLFHQRQGRLLTRRAYREIGGVQGALVKHAEHTYQSLPTQRHQQLARALFLRLVNPGTMEQDATKLRVPLTQLVVSDPEETTRLEMVTRTFISARLLTANTISGLSTIEVSHEALLRAWTRLRDWFHEARDDIRLQQTINKDALEWQQHEQPTDRLYRGTQLTEALQWRAVNLPNRDEESFLQASLKEHQRLEHQRRQVLTRRLVLIGAAGILGITGTIFFMKSFLGASPAPIIVYRNHSQPVLKVAWSPIATSHLLASAGRDHTIHVWNVLTGKDSSIPYGDHTDAIFSLAWSPDGRRIASGSNDKKVLVYDLATGQTITEYKKHTANVSGVARSPDGQTIASVGDKTENGIHFWNANTGEDLFSPLRKDSHQIYVLSWSHNGQFIAAGGQGKSALVWDVPNRTFATSFPNDGEVYALAWSYDDRYLATGGQDGTVKIWNVAGQQAILTYREHQGAIHGLSWSPDGQRIVSTAYDGTVRVWDSTGKTLQVYSGLEGAQKGKSVDWSPDGAYIAAAFSDPNVTTIPVWQAP